MKAKKIQFNYKQIIREFARLRELANEAAAPVIPTPTSAMISSFTSYSRHLLRGGVPVGGQSLQDILDFADLMVLKPTTGRNETFCVSCVVDCERDEPFFAILLSTKLLLDQFNSMKPIETDETFKVMHEGYALTLIGQSDMNRVWHLRYASSNSNTPRLNDV